MERSLDLSLPAGYSLRHGSTLDKPQLVKFMHRTYRELLPEGETAHLLQTVEQYFSQETPLWWVDWRGEQANQPSGPSGFPHSYSFSSIACLWVGSAIDQLQGDRHAHVFLLYVAPEHRHRGIGTSLMRHAEAWALQRGDRQIGLQVFQFNQPALNLYQQLGYQTQSLWMVKPLAINPQAQGASDSKLQSQ